MLFLKPGGTYHIYNRANGNEKIFKREGNYFYFLDKFKLHITPVADLYCYCLMPNHFHFLLRIKTESELHQVFQKTGISSADFPKQISKRFSNFFSSYSQAFNKEQKRMGSLFMKNFKRKIIDDKNYLYTLVRYIHQNPVEARLCNHPHQWKFSSYSKIICQNTHLIQSKIVLSWFEDLEDFKKLHTVSEKFNIEI